MRTGFAIRLDTVEPVHHLVGLAVRAEQAGAAAVLVGAGRAQRDVVVAVAAMAVATGRVPILPLFPGASPAAVRRARPALQALDELSGARVVSCFPAAALRDHDGSDPPTARMAGDRVVSTTGAWRIWCPPAARPEVIPTGGAADAVAYRLERYDVAELGEIAAHARAAGLTASVALAGVAG